jgi:hypothetical protein
VNEGSLLAENAAGAQASQHYEFFRPILESVREDMKREWLNTSSEQTDMREHIWRALHALDDIENKIIAIINTGKMARVALDRRP